jgi:hypothetical protein
MPDLIRPIRIKTAGPEDKHCDPDCPKRARFGWCQIDADAQRTYDFEARCYLRTPECLRDAKSEQDANRGGK